MSEIWQGLVKAIELIVTLDPEVMQIAGRSLAISVAATILAAVICLPSAVSSTSTASSVKGL